MARRLTSPIFTMVVIALLLLVPARGQGVPPAPAVDPKLTTDAGRCLEIDNESAALATQLRAGVITAAVRKERADALAAERLRITKLYGATNTAPYRALVAEYNRLKAAAATAARERIAADNQAKKEAAAAELKAKRDAAAAETKAKQEAALALAAEKAERRRGIVRRRLFRRR